MYLLENYKQLKNWTANLGQGKVTIFAYSLGYNVCPLFTI